MAEGAKINNSDVATLCNRVCQFMQELIVCQSHGVAHMLKQDQDRLAQYLNSMDRVRMWVLGQPQLDLPKTHPQDWAIKQLPQIPDDMENEDVRNVLVLLGMSHDELFQSQSASMPSGLLSYDATRLENVIDKTRKFLEDYVKVSTPLDLPETAR